MSDLFFGGQALWFTLPAFAGTLFFLLRLTMMMAVGHVGSDFHVSDASAFDVDHADSGAQFKILSVQAISAFLMGFGWGGLGAYRGWGLPAVLSVPVGAAVGFAMMWMLGRLLRWVAGLQSSGTVELSAALYEEGTVYSTIPARGSGRGVVRLVVDERLRYYNAISEGEPIETQARVRVTSVNEDNTVTVTRIKDDQ
jgi:hypothetical protein